MEIIPTLAVAAVPILGALIWWLFRSRLAQDQREHERLDAGITANRNIITEQAGRTVSTDDCRVCHNSTINSLQAVQVRLTTLQDSVADVRERVAAGMGTLTGKLDTLTRLVAAKTTVKDH